MPEKWRDIENYEGLYQISNYGRIMSFPRRGTSSHLRILEPRKNKGYLQVGLHKNKKEKKFFIHQLVAKAFIRNLERKPQVNHIDGNKENNKVDNLEWCNNSENQIHAYKIGLKKKRSFEIIQYTLDMKRVKKWNCVSEIEKSTGFHYQNISACCKNKQKTAYRIYMEIWKGGKQMKRTWKNFRIDPNKVYMRIGRAVVYSSLYIATVGFTVWGFLQGMTY